MQFKSYTQEAPTDLYINYDRAQKAVSTEKPKEVTTTETSYNWKVPEITEVPSISDYQTRLREHIIKEEGFRDKAYKDGKYYSIGYGFNDAKYKEGDTMTREEADLELDRQLKEREAKYRQRFGSRWDNLSDNRKIALMSYGYNTGDNNIINGDIAKYLDEGNMEKLRDSIKINTFNGSYYEPLEQRRRRERLLFDS